MTICAYNINHSGWATEPTTGNVNGACAWSFIAAANYEMVHSGFRGNRSAHLEPHQLCVRKKRAVAQKSPYSQAKGRDRLLSETQQSKLVVFSHDVLQSRVQQHGGLEELLLGEVHGSFCGAGVKNNRGCLWHAHQSTMGSKECDGRAK